MVRRTAEAEEAYEEAPELTDAELAEMRPAREVHSPEEFAALTAVRKRGRPFAVIKKVPVTIRLDADTVAAFKAMGQGWQTAINDMLRRGVQALPARDASSGAFLGTKKGSNGKVGRAQRAKASA